MMHIHGFIHIHASIISGMPLKTILSLKKYFIFQKTKNIWLIKIKINCFFYFHYGILFFFVFFFLKSLVYFANVYIAPNYFYKIKKSFNKALQYIYLTLQSVIAAAINNLAQFDCLRPCRHSTKSFN